MAFFEIASLGYWRALITSLLVDDSVVALREKPFRGALEPSSELMAMAHKLRTYADLLQKIHNDLRLQHPEWIQPNGECPTCDSYEARLMELLAASIRSGADETSAFSDRELSQCQ